jgi:hypothetical protein
MLACTAHSRRSEMSGSSSSQMGRSEEGVGVALANVAAVAAVFAGTWYLLMHPHMVRLGAC